MMVIAEVALANGRRGAMPEKPNKTISVTRHRGRTPSKNVAVAQVVKPLPQAISVQ